MEEYEITKYPEGYERLANEQLDFLPEDEAVRADFMKQVLQFLTQW